MHEKLIFETDESFEWCSSPITFDDLWAGEHYDARLEVEKCWKPVALTKAPKGEKRDSSAFFVRIKKEVSPRAIIPYKNGYIYNYPIKEAQNLLTCECEYVKINGTTIKIYSLKGELLSTWQLLGVNGIKKIEHVDILFDKKMVEIFINGGLISISQWLV